MIFADKLISLRKKNGWSQEELAEKMNVSRQAVSKWEAAQTTPDLERILQLSKLFGVTTDYLLKDEQEEEVFTGDDSDEESARRVRRVSLADAQAFIAWRRLASVRIAVATFLCIIACIPLLILAVFAEDPASGISENIAALIGLGVLLTLVAIAVAIFVSVGMRNKPYEFLEKEAFETEYGVAGMVREKQKAFRDSYMKSNIIASCLCVLSPVPLIGGALLENDFLCVVMLCVTLLIVGIAAVLFIVAGVRWASMEKLLREGEFTEKEKGKSSIRGAIATAYWLFVTALFLLTVFLPLGKLSAFGWVIWPIAGILFAGIMLILGLVLDKKDR